MMPSCESWTQAQLEDADARLAPRDGRWWDSFYEDRAKPCTFFANAPDESLAEWVEAGLIAPGRAIEFGCGNGRNALFLARQGFAVEGVDYSANAIAWARERVVQAQADVTLTHGNVFDLVLPREAHDLVYDSGCFHHIAPHRRRHYVERVVGTLKPGGWFGLTCFRPEGGSGLTDEEVYERGSLGGGLGYSEAQLRAIWSAGLEIQVLRQMVRPAGDSGRFGEDYLWALLARKT
jgi:SAM-dependent methyltransferase